MIIKTKSKCISYCCYQTGTTLYCGKHCKLYNTYSTKWGGMFACYGSTIYINLNKYVKKWANISANRG